MSIWKKTNYTTPLRYVQSSIYEYDIRKANISILLKYGAISKETYNEFLVMDKKERQIKIGLMQRENPKLKQVLETGFEEARKLLIESNSIELDEIISIKKDALFITRPLHQTSFSPIEFVLKNRYDIFLKTECPKLEFFFGVDNEESILDVKGVKDEALPIHYDTWVTFLCNLFGYLLNNDIDSAIKYLSSISKSYINRLLPVEWYREFNSQSHFRIIPGFVSEFTIDRAPDPSYMGALNIEYNYNLLMSLNTVISELYLETRRRGGR
jgi:hypothetical protein